MCVDTFDNFSFLSELNIMQQCNSYRTRHGLNENIREIVCVYVCTFDNLFSL